MANVKFSFLAESFEISHELNKAFRKAGYRTITCADNHSSLIMVFDGEKDYEALCEIRERVLTKFRR